MSPPGAFTPGQQRPQEVLQQRALESYTGRLELTSATGEVASVWFDEGRIVAAAVPGPRPRLGVRLLSAGLVRPEALDGVLRVQASDPEAGPVGEMLVALGAVDPTEVEHVARVQVVDQISDLLGWDIIGTAVVDEDCAPADLSDPLDADDLVAEAGARRHVWEAMVLRLGGPKGVPSPSMLAAPRANLLLGPYDWAVLTKVDGLRNVETLADHCGLSLYETAQILTGLADVGLIVLPPVTSPPPEAQPRRRPAAEAANLLRELSALSRETKRD